jgi:hypothetical protein
METRREPYPFQGEKRLMAGTCWCFWRLFNSSSKNYNFRPVVFAWSADFSFKKGWGIPDAKIQKRIVWGGAVTLSPQICQEGAAQ